MKFINVQCASSDTHSPAQHGYIVLVLVIPLSLITFLMLQMSTLTHELLATKALFKRQVVAENNLTLHLANLPHYARGCEHVRINADPSLPSRWSVCLFKRSNWITRPAISLPDGAPNYHEILKTPNNCPSERRPPETNTFTTPEASTTCEVGTITLHHDLILHDNIHGEFASIDSTTEKSYLTIASPGTIRFKEGLHTNAPLLIIAGGSISIPVLSNSGSNPVPVTLFSALGDISVSSQAPDIALLAIGRRALDTPPTGSLTGVFPLPQFSALSISGFVSSY